MKRQLIRISVTRGATIYLLITMFRQVKQKTEEEEITVVPGTSFCHLWRHHLPAHHHVQTSQE